MLTTLEIKVINMPSKKEKFYCEICKFPIMTREDFSVKEYECCYECFLTFAESRKSEWKKGWRPEKNLIDSYILLRNKNSKKEIV